MSGGDVVILNHPIFSRKIFINFNKDILKPKVLPQIDSQSSPKSYRIPPRRYILKSRGGKYGYGGGDKNEDPAQYNEYVYKSSRKDKPKFSDYVKTETDLDDDENQIPIRNEQKRITTLIHSIKKPSKSDLFLPASFEKPSDIKMSGLISPRAHLASDRLMMSPKNSLGTDYVFMTSPRNNKTPRY